MVNKWTAITMFVLTAFLASPAGAETAHSTKSPVTVSDLDAIMQEEIVLKASVNRAKQRAELGRYAGVAQSASHTSRALGLPQLAWRRSTSTGWLAKFILSDGASIIGGPGESLPGGFEISQIDERGVKLKRDGELIELTAAASATRQSPETARPVPMHPGAFQLPASQ